VTRASRDFRADWRAAALNPPFGAAVMSSTGASMDARDIDRASRLGDAFSKFVHIIRGNP